MHGQKYRTWYISGDKCPFEMRSAVSRSMVGGARRQVRQMTHLPGHDHFADVRKMVTAGKGEGPTTKRNGPRPDPEIRRGQGVMRRECLCTAMPRELRGTSSAPAFVHDPDQDLSFCPTREHQDVPRISGAVAPSLPTSTQHGHGVPEDAAHTHLAVQAGRDARTRPQPAPETPTAGQRGQRAAGHGARHPALPHLTCSDDWALTTHPPTHSPVHAAMPESCRTG